MSPAANTNTRPDPRAALMAACTVNGLAWLCVGYLAGCAAWAELVFAGAGFAAAVVAVS
jgi:hypothetical protein